MCIHALILFCLHRFAFIYKSAVGDCKNEALDFSQRRSGKKLKPACAIQSRGTFSGGGIGVEEIAIHKTVHIITNYVLWSTCTCTCTVLHNVSESAGHLWGFSIKGQ